MNQLALKNEARVPDVLHLETETFVTVYVGEQLFGIPVDLTRDILVPENIYHIPLASEEVAGPINLRGRIVTVIDMRARLGLKPFGKKRLEGRRCVTVEHMGELYSLLVDGIGDILELNETLFDPPPTTLRQAWKEIRKGVCRLEDEILVVLDIEHFLDIRSCTA